MASQKLTKVENQLISIFKPFEVQTAKHSLIFIDIMVKSASQVDQVNNGRRNDRISMNQDW